MRRGWRLVVVLTLLASPVVSLHGCSCSEPGPWLGSDQDGAPAVGWVVTEAETVVRLQLLEGEAVRWQIDAVDGTPRVVTVGDDVEGFTTVVPLARSASLEGMTLRVEFRSGSSPGLESPGDFSLTREELAQDRPPATVRELECGFSGFEVDWRAPLQVVVIVVGALLGAGTLVVVLLAAISRLRT